MRPASFSLCTPSHACPQDLSPTSSSPLPVNTSAASPRQHREGVGVLKRLSPDSSAHSARARPPWETHSISVSAATQVLCCKGKSALLSHLKVLILADI